MQYEMYPGELAHYGVSGMKWGIRRQRRAAVKDYKKSMARTKKLTNYKYQHLLLPVDDRNRLLNNKGHGLEKKLYNTNLSKKQYAKVEEKAKRYDALVKNAQQDTLKKAKALDNFNSENRLRGKKYVEESKAMMLKLDNIDYQRLKRDITRAALASL